MNWLDIVIALFFIVSIIGGIRAGIVKILFSIAGLIIGVVLAGAYSESLGDKLGFISDHKTAGIVAFVIIMLVVMIVATILAFVIKKVASAVLLGWVDKLGGAVLGLVLGMIFAGAILTMYLKFAGDTSAIVDSAIAGFLLDKFPIVMGFLPSQFDGVRDFFN
jgi:membrane protein required for colicin V production